MLVESGIGHLLHQPAGCEVEQTHVTNCNLA